MTPIQAAAIVFALVMAYLTYVAWRRKQIPGAGLVLWEGVWACLAIVSIAPQLFQWLIRPLHVARLMDLVVIVGLLVLGAITFRTYAVAQHVQAEVERMVREQALATIVPAGGRPEEGGAPRDRLSPGG